MIPTSDPNPAGMRRYDHTDLLNNAEYQALVVELETFLNRALRGQSMTYNSATAVAAQLGIGANISDTCPQCQAGTAVPYRVQISDSGANGSYRCRFCRNEWSCSWSLRWLGHISESMRQ